MDIQRIRDLEKLAGLNLAADERVLLAAELTNISRFVTCIEDVPDSQVPETPEGKTAEKFSGLMPDSNSNVAKSFVDFDRTIVLNNAPEWEKPYFLVRPVRSRSGGGNPR